MKLFIGINLILILFQFRTSAQSVNFFVSVNGSDKNIGSKSYPFLTIGKAKYEVAKLIKKSNSDVIINLRAGTYVLDSTLIFNATDGGNDRIKVEYKAYKNEQVVISGGKYLENCWEKVAVKKNGTLWKINILKTLDNKWIFKDLFKDGKRVCRASSKWYKTQGPLDFYKDKIKHYGYDIADKLKTEDILPFCSFKYNEKDLSEIENIKGLDLILYSSWEASWHQINSLDKDSKVITLKTPSRYPVGFFTDHNFYRIENAKIFLTEPNNWCLDTEKGTLYYMSPTYENPNDNIWMIPRLSELIKVSGENATNKIVGNLHFSGLSFQHTSRLEGINDINLDLKGRYTKKYNWLDFKSGYSSSQGAPDCGQSISYSNAQDCSVSNCEFSKLSGYGINLSKNVKLSRITNCKFSDIGGGGVIIGSSLPSLISGNENDIFSNNNVVESCEFHNGGLVYPASIAILIMHADHISILKNKIDDFPYSAISTGWSWGSKPNFTNHILIKNNIIHNVMNKLADGAGVYTLGKQEGTVISENLIYDISRSPYAIGFGNNAMFFDEGSSEITVKNNIVYQIEDEYFRLNKAKATLSISDNYVGTSSIPYNVPLKLLKKIKN